ncbi:MAG: right-handed parallel beta-helix repeat-containing protein [Fibrobacterota bacterium]
MNKKHHYMLSRFAWPWPILAGFLFSAGSLIYADRYVVEPGTPAIGPVDPANPYTNWAEAATNIQWAVNVAAGGETVWVSNGTYRCSSVSSGLHPHVSGGNIITSTAMIVITNSITLRSWSGNYSNTIIDGNYPAWTTRVVLAVNTGAVLDGLTISNGWIFTNTIPYTNSGLLQGGAGIFFVNGSLVTNCLVTRNYVSNNYSGTTIGIQINTGKISHCVISENRFRGTQAGIAGVQIRAGIISNCVLTGNGHPSVTTVRAIDILSDPNQRVIVANCDINGNSGQGLRISGNNWQISSCNIRNNTLGGIYPLAAGNTNCLIQNCLIVGNKDGMRCSYNSQQLTIRIENCTFANNSDYAIRTDFAYGATNMTLANSILYYNNAGGANWWAVGGTNAVYSNCCTMPIPTNMPGLPEGTGNITNAPVFVDTNVANYRLAVNSPCINAGVNQSWMNDAADLDGNKRIMYRIVDMGVYESFPPAGAMIYVW